MLLEKLVSSLLLDDVQRCAPVAVSAALDHHGGGRHRRR
jgi:hypothetical protein